MKRVLLSLCAVLIAVLAEADPIAENQARFGQVNGAVQILPSGAVNWLEARIDLPVDAGDQIQVDEESSVELIISDNAMWIVEGPAELIMGRTSPQEGRISLRYGTLFGKVETPNMQVGNWTFETPVGVCAVRGTEFVLTHTPEDGTHLGVFKGVVEMKAAESATENFAPILIHAREEGVLKKNTPVKKLASFSPMMKNRSARLPVLQKRFRAASQVYSPFTTVYRKELRDKYVPAPPKPKKLRGPVRKRPGTS
jgi:hypothetical protein